MRYAPILFVALSTPAFATRLPEPLRAGDYLDTAYIAALTRTRSPHEAAASAAGMPELVTVEADGRARRFAASYGWRTGTLLFTLSRTGWLRREIAWGNTPTPALRVRNVSAFCLTTARTEHCYHYVGNAQHFIAAATLAGTYVDRQGAPYRFTADGTATFPGAPFHYDLGLDETERKFDYFTAESGNILAWHRAGALLTLYALTGGKPDYAHPVAVLRESLVQAAGF